VSKIEANTKGVAMFDRAQWFLAGMSIALSLQLSQPVSAAVPVGKVVQTAQTNRNEAAQKVYEEAEKLYQQGTAEALRGAIDRSRSSFWIPGWRLLRSRLVDQYSGQFLERYYKLTRGKDHKKVELNVSQGWS
jgi:hypothetical protein